MSGSHPPSSWLIEHDKITKYLLNLSHRKGASRAKFFLRFGFDIAQPQVLALALAKHPIMNPPGREFIPDEGDPRLIYEGPIETPDGRNPSIRTVWELRRPDEGSFVTAIPLTR